MGVGGRRPVRGPWCLSAPEGPQWDSLRRGRVCLAPGNSSLEVQQIVCRQRPLKGETLAPNKDPRGWLGLERMSFPRPISVFGELPTRPPPWPRDTGRRRLRVGRSKGGSLRAPAPPSQSGAASGSSLPPQGSLTGSTSPAPCSGSEGQSPEFQPCADSLLGAGLPICKVSSAKSLLERQRGTGFSFFLHRDPPV